MATEFNTRIKFKRDTSSNWTNKNPVILNGEIILVDTDSGELRAKVGDGVKSYTQLPFSDEVIRNLIPTDLSELNQDSTHRLVTDSEKQTWNNKSDFDGDYYSLTSRPTIPTQLSQLSSDSTHRLVTDTEKNIWNNKSDFNGNYNNLTNKPTIPTQLSQLSSDSTHRTVTDTEKSTWNNKSDFSGNYNDLTNQPVIPDVSDYVKAKEPTGITTTVPPTFDGYTSNQFVLKNEIIDNLISQINNKPLSANQGYVLNNIITLAVDNIGIMENLETNEKNSLVESINELFTSVSNGKSQIASAITDKGVSTSNNDTFQQMANNINLISTGMERLIINDDSIVPTGRYANDTYYNTSFGVKVAYFSNGQIGILMQGGSSTDYSEIDMEIGNAPSGVYLNLVYGTTYRAGTSRKLFMGLISGITKKVEISIDMSSRWPTGPIVTISMEEV